ncbi:hypothetical protein BHM03_00022464, partial [Ensete ventricosum]
GEKEEALSSGGWQQRLAAGADRVGRDWAATGRGYVAAEQRKQGRQAEVEEGNGQMAGGERLRSDGAEGMKRSGRWQEAVRDGSGERAGRWQLHRRFGTIATAGGEEELAGGMCNRGDRQRGATVTLATTRATTRAGEDVATAEAAAGSRKAAREKIVVIELTSDRGYSSLYQEKRTRERSPRKKRLQWRQLCRRLHKRATAGTNGSGGAGGRQSRAEGRLGREMRKPTRSSRKRGSRRRRRIIMDKP